MPWPADVPHGRCTPFREVEVAVVQHGRGTEELRIFISWSRRGDGAVLEMRQFGRRAEGDPIPTKWGFRIDAAKIPELIDGLTKAALTCGEHFTKEN